MRSVNHISFGKIEDSEDIQDIVNKLNRLLNIFGTIRLDLTAVKGSVPEWYEGVAVANHGLERIDKEDVSSERWSQIEQAQYLFDGLEDDYSFFHEPEEVQDK